VKNTTVGRCFASIARALESSRAVDAPGIQRILRAASATDSSNRGWRKAISASVDGGRSSSQGCQTTFSALTGKSQRLKTSTPWPRMAKAPGSSANAFSGPLRARLEGL
jgi:hypothetical protein